MEWDTDQYARLFKVIARKFWDAAVGQPDPRPIMGRWPPLRPPGYPHVWDKYISELGIQNSALSGSPSWEELCGRTDIIKINILYDKKFCVGLPPGCKGHPKIVGDLAVSSKLRAQRDRMDRLFFAAQDQENIFVTDPSLSTYYRKFEDWSVKATSVRSEILSVLGLVGNGHRNQQKGGEILAVPKHTAENILVLGLP